MNVSSSSPSPLPWKKIESQPAGDFRIFTIREDKKQSPRTGEEHGFFVLDCVNWVNVVPVTEEGQLVLIEQFRHGSETVELEVPGGMMDSDETSPLITGVRELREETGYEGQEAELIGEVFPNPALMSNTCYTLLVRNCRKLHETEFDYGEDLVTRLVDVDDIPSMISSGRIKHSLVIVALYHYQLWLKRQG